MLAILDINAIPQLEERLNIAYEETFEAYAVLSEAINETRIASEIYFALNSSSDNNVFTEASRAYNNAIKNEENPRRLFDTKMKEVNTLKSAIAEAKARFRA